MREDQRPRNRNWNVKSKLIFAMTITYSKIVQIEWFKMPHVQESVLYPNINFARIVSVKFFAIKNQIQKMPIKIETLKNHNLSSVNPIRANLGSKIFS